MITYICECGNEFASDMDVCPACGSGIVFVKENVESIAKCGIAEQECKAVDYAFRNMSENEYLTP